MKITIEPDQEGENDIAPMVFENVAEFASIHRVAGHIGVIQPPHVHTHGNLWDCYRMLGEARDRLLGIVVTSLKDKPDGDAHD